MTKYYVQETTRDSRGRILKSERLTGNTEDVSWARKQMEYRFNKKLIDLRHQIKPGAIKITKNWSTLDLKNGSYKIEIKKLEEPKPVLIIGIGIIR